MIVRIEVMNTSRRSFTDLNLLIAYLKSRTNRNKVNINFYTTRPAYFRVELDLKRYTIFCRRRAKYSKKIFFINSSKEDIYNDFREFIKKIDKME